MPRILRLPSTLTLIAVTGLAAEEAVNPAPQTPPPVTTAPSLPASLPTITVVGSSQADAERLPGSATVLDEALLSIQRADNPVQALRLVPGVNAADEDGYGLRTNIGIRGVDPNRSEKVLLMEDGVPIASNPYGDPTSYFSPVFGRYRTVEVIKGSGQILYGPQTVSGAVNFVTRPIPKDPGGFVDFAMGSHETVRGHVGTGGKFSDDFGASIEAYAIRSAGFREGDDFHKYDVAGKLGWIVNDAHSLEWKLVYGGEESHATYQGLSESDFGRDPYQKYNFTRNDLMDAYRLLTHLRHRWQYTSLGSLTTTAYYQYIDRSWTRALGVFNAARGTYEQGPSGSRDRHRYYGQGGLELRLTQALDLGVPVDLETGLRGHIEQQQRRDMNISLAGVRTPTTHYNRQTEAGAAFFQAATHLTDDLTITPGVRVERIRITSQRTDGALRGEGVSTLTEYLPGLGAIWQLAEHHQIYAGVHRGFSPPSYAAAITDNGQDTELDAERSWNYELGLRCRYTDFHGELALFHIDYENIINAGTGSTPFFNAGEATHLGAEALIGCDLRRAVDTEFSLPVRLTATALRATYDDDVVSGNAVVARAGNDIPYAPRFQGSAMAGIAELGSRQAFSFHLTATFTGRRFTDGLNTAGVTVNGRAGALPSVFLLDAAARFAPRDDWYEIYLTGSNLLDNRYASTRRPEGTFAGAPLTVMGGVKATF